MRKYVKIVGLILIISFVYILFVHSLMMKAASTTPPPNISHVIVLGAKLNGDVMSLSLYYRVQKALEYLEDHKEAKVIVSGGQGKGETITEAKAMAKFFIEKGIEEERIILEETSTNTNENFKFSREIVGENVKEIIVVTNDFHLFRSMIIAKRQGFNPSPLAADTPWIVRGKLWVREYIAILKTAVFDW